MENRSRFALVAALIALGTASRLLPHPPNMTPVLALALLGGAYLKGPAAFLLPLGMLAASDLFLGFHSTVPFVYAGFLLAAWLGRGLEQAGPSKLGAKAAGGSLAFFAISNFGVWAATGLYAKTGAGLVECYAAALPFLRYSLLSDLAYTFVLFGLVRLAATLTERRTAEAA